MPRFSHKCGAERMSSLWMLRAPQRQATLQRVSDGIDVSAVDSFHSLAADLPSSADDKCLLLFSARASMGVEVLYGSERKGAGN